MKNTVHYEENLFYIDAKLKILNQGLTAGIDPEVFKDNILSDLHFIDLTLNSIYSQLKYTPNIRQIDLYYKLLNHSKGKFITLLENILKNTYSLSHYLDESRKDQLTTYIRNHKTDMLQIKQQATATEEQAPEDVISGAELDFLLASHSEENPS